jgi:hypothetical protein
LPGVGNRAVIKKRRSGSHNILQAIGNMANQYAKEEDWRQKIFKTDQTFMQEEKKLRQNILSGVDNRANLFCRWKELAWLTCLQEGMNWRQNILPGLSSMSPRLIKPLYRRGRTGGRISCLVSAAWFQD